MSRIKQILEQNPFLSKPLIEYVKETDPSDTCKYANFLVKIIKSFSENELNIIEARARNHLCYSKTAEMYDQEIRERIKKGENEKNVVEEFNKKFEILQKLSMLVEVRSQVLSGNYWKLAGITSYDMLNFLKEV
jgi:hypothetical protein